MKALFRILFSIAALVLGRQLWKRFQPSQSQAGYTIERFPLSRRLVVDTTRIAQNKTLMRGLIEVDVTEPRRIIREHRERTGERFSFTAFLLYCIGQTIDEDKQVHAYQDWRGRLVIFDEVDITTIIEIELEDKKFPLAHIVRAANQRTLREIHGEIRAIQSNPKRERGLQYWQVMGAFLHLPGFLRRLIYRFVLSKPHLMKRYIGTVGLTAIGMFGEGSGWGIGNPVYNLNFTVGGIAQKPGVLDDTIQIREILNLTLDFNHDIIDGAPAARFTKRLKERIESGCGLEEATQADG